MSDVTPPLHEMRIHYAEGRLLEADLAPAPLGQLTAWLADAVASGIPEPNAMVLATVDATGTPSARTVLLKGVDGRGLSFFTNLGSRKARAIAENPQVSLVLPWHAMMRQVVVVGRADLLDRDEVASYFVSRPYGSRLGAWASEQSSVIASREVLKARYAELAAAFPDTGSPDDVPVPDGWGGYVVRPTSVEFWQGRPSRLHDRLRYLAVDGAPGAALDDAAGWRTERLSP
jgi:pyridoxamine 5'-phosphate oxidase